MRFPVYLFVLASLFAFIPQDASARSWLDYIFPPAVPDFSKPGLYDGKTQHLAIYEMDDWTPEVWTENRGTEKAVMDDLYIHGIITNQFFDDEVPVLEVGQHFMELSGNDKRRVAAYVDHVFGITGRSPNGMFMIQHEKYCDEPIGYYTKEGLFLQ